MQRLMNRRQGIQQLLGGLQAGPQNVETMSRQLELENALYQTQNELRTRGFEIEKDINQLMVDRRKEFEHSFLTAGPAEMLRKLAAMRMTQGGQMTMGQFLSLSPDMRREVSQMDTRFDPQMMDLRREKNRGTPQTVDAFDAGQLAISQQVAAIAAKLKDVLPDTAVYDAAKKSVDALGMSAGTAAAALTSLSGVVQGLVKAISPGTAPRNPQSGGTGAGIGHKP
jgi:hypothetical protein